MKLADYLITRASYTAYGMIDEVDIYKVDDNNYIHTSETLTRYDLQRLLEHGHNIKTGTFSAEESWTWRTVDNVYLHRSYLNVIINTSQFYASTDGLGNLPKVLPRRKTFTSFYHRNDETYRLKFEALTRDLVVNKSVKDGDINKDVSTDYIKWLVQDGHLSDTSLIVCLIGPKTRCRKHVDWEISGGLNVKVGERYAGLLGLLLPSHTDYGTGQVHYDYIPDRLADNFKTGYAVVTDWTTDRVTLQNMIELAFGYRISKEDQRDNSRVQMTQNRCD